MSKLNYSFRPSDETFIINIGQKRVKTFAEKLALAERNPLFQYHIKAMKKNNNILPTVQRNLYVAAVERYC